MAIFDNLAKAAKDFFIEEDPAATPPAAPRPLPTAPGSAASPAGFTAPAPAVVQPEQRHLDHIQQLLAGDGKDFVAYTKMVKSLAASGLTGPLLYQTAFNAFAAVTGLDLPTLLASADHFEQILTADRHRVLERHREKLGEVRGASAAASPLVQLQQKEQQLQLALTELQRQLEQQQQLLVATRQQLQEQQQRASAALASYELAHTTAATELHAHRQAVQAFLQQSAAGPAPTPGR